MEVVQQLKEGIENAMNEQNYHVVLYLPEGIQDAHRNSKEVYMIGVHESLKLTEREAIKEWLIKDNDEVWVILDSAYIDYHFNKRLKSMREEREYELREYRNAKGI